MIKQRDGHSGNRDSTPIGTGYLISNTSNSRRAINNPPLPLLPAQWLNTDPTCSITCLRWHVCGDDLHTHTQKKKRVCSGFLGRPKFYLSDMGAPSPEIRRQGRAAVMPRFERYGACANIQGTWKYTLTPPNCPHGLNRNFSLFTTIWIWGVMGIRPGVTSSFCAHCA